MLCKGVFKRTTSSFVALLFEIYLHFATSLKYLLGLKGKRVQVSIKYIIQLAAAIYKYFISI